MPTLDDTEIIPADESGDTPAPSRRAPQLWPEKGRPSSGTPAGCLARFLTALLRALAAWPT
jgi:hypothetical protein